MVQEGEKLSELLSMPIKDALAREIPVDYSEDIVNIRDILDASNARKNIFNDSVELQKLTLKQMALIFAYESDAEQVCSFNIINNADRKKSFLTMEREKLIERSLTRQIYLQAVRWLSDLFGVVVENHTAIGSHASEIQAQKEEHQTFQDTAKVHTTFCVTGNKS